jgi:hypothetical protein
MDEYEDMIRTQRGEPPEWMDVIITMIDGMVNKYYAKEDGEHLYEIHTEIIIDLEGIKTALQEKAKP